MDLLLAVGVWALGAWVAYRCTRRTGPADEGRAPTADVGRE